jgi:hypothetical protein
MNSGFALFYHMQLSNFRACCEAATGIMLMLILVDTISGNSPYLSEAHLSDQTIQTGSAKKIIF